MNSNTRRRAPEAPPLPWRDAAMNQALRGDFRQRLQILLAAIRQARPGYATQIAGPDYEPMMKFLRALGPLRPLLSASCRTDSDEGDAAFYIGWFAVEWKGAALEVALAPSFHANRIICMGRDEAAVEEFTKELSDFSLRPLGRSLRYSEGWENAPDIDAEIGKVTWDDIVLPPDILSQLRRSIDGFFAHREAMRDFGFAWRRGVLLVGPPGTGKTMVCKAAAASHPDLPFLYVRDLREEDGNESIQAVFERARKLAPCILAFEDIDGFVTDANRTVFLNEMDGFTSNDGLLVIASSNHPGKIDEALLKRPSRFDRVFHLGLPAKPERIEYCRRVLGKSSLARHVAPDFDTESLAEAVGDKTDGFTPAYLKEAFTAAALQRAQQGAVVLDRAFYDAVLEQAEELKQYIKKSKNPESLAEMRGADDTIGFRR